MGLLGILKKNSDKVKPLNFKEDRHFLFVEKLFSSVADEILEWGCSSWWPKSCGLEYVCDSSDGIVLGAVCRLVVRKGVFRIVLKGTVVQVRDGRILQIEWSSVLIKAQETVTVEERSNGTRIDHCFLFVGTNVITQLIWIFLFRKKHDQAIAQALEALNKYFTVDNG